MKKHQSVLEKHLPDEATKLSIFLTALERFTARDSSTSAWTTSRGPTTSSRGRGASARCTGISRATRRRPAPTSSASA
jgi:hypothetical protein